jgi:segregation and condensation protein A
MASELIHLKSKMLLNKKDEEDDSEYEINNEEELQRRLLEYEKIKGIANNFKDLEEKRSEVFTKLPSNLEEYRTDNNIINSDVSINDLIKAFESFLKRQKDSEPLNTTVTKKEISVEERCLSIKNFIHQKGKVNFTALFDDVSKPYVIVTFLSILNMTKNKEIIISQNKNFGDIFIEESMI